MRQNNTLLKTSAAVFTIVAALFVAVLGSPAAARADSELIDSGHVDAFYVSAPGGQLTLSMKEAVTGSGVVRPGNDVILKVAEEAWSEATERIDGIAMPTYYLVRMNILSMTRINYRPLTLTAAAALALSSPTLILAAPPPSRPSRRATLPVMLTPSTPSAADTKTSLWSVTPGTCPL